jgi:LysM repeat protein
VGVAVGIGLLFVALVQIRAWIFDLQARVDQVAADNKLYQSKLEEALARLPQPDQQAQTESSRPSKPAPRNGPALAEAPVQEKAPSPTKAPPVKTKTSTEPLRTYKVCYRAKRGEDLTEISERFRVSVDQLRNWNGLKATDTVMAGQALDIYTRTTTDRLGYMASARGSAKANTTRKKREEDSTVEAETLPRADDQGTETEVGESVPDTQISSQKEQPVSADDDTYIVQPGDNLERIGRIHGRGWRSIADVNGIDNPNAIYAGQILRIPAR